jgi:hypothetical protein
LFVAVGFALLYIALRLYAHYCGWPGVYALSYTCVAMRNNPPWPLLTALVAGPPALLTWYWRTQHKKDDIDHASAAERNARFANAVELLSKGQAGGIFVLEGVARDSPEKYHWPVVETLASTVRGWYGDDAQGAAPPTVMRQALLRALGRRNKEYDQGRVIDLSRTNLAELDFRGLNFDGANFENAKLQKANLTGFASFVAANFSNAKADGALFDDSTKLDRIAATALKASGARDQTPEHVDAVQAISRAAAIGKGPTR